MFEMALTSDEGGAIEHATVVVNLRIQTPQGISVRFDFVAVKHAVYHRDVDPHLAATDTKLFNDHGIRDSRKLCQQ